VDRGRWQRLSLREQMGHITSEIARATHWEDRGDLFNRNRALERALELLDLTLACRRETRCREWTRLREVTADLFLQAGMYRISLKDLLHYGLSFLLRK
jgi:hypothetical protein